MTVNRRLDELQPDDDPSLIISLHETYPIDVKVREGVHGGSLKAWLEEQGFDFYWVTYPRRLAFRDKSQAAATKLQWA